MTKTMKTELIRKRKVRWADETSPEVPTVAVAEATGIADLSKLQGKPAGACIYCGSRMRLSREHVLAYGLGGVTTIPRGSCEGCRKITSEFETAVLRGPMRMVRYIQGMPSATKHRDVPETVRVKVAVNGIQRSINVPRREAPILLPFPIFEPPLYLGAGKSELRLAGMVTGSFGIDPDEFAKKLGATELELKVSKNDAVAFARLVAKTAYAYAHIQGELQRLKNCRELVQAIMKEPNAIGRFVGTAPQPFIKYPGLQHRISIHIMPERRLLYATVQLFAGAGAPNYIVVLGTLRDDDPMTDLASAKA
jgi:hypothetical protein